MSTAASRADAVRAVVDETKAYYDGAADAIYKDIWGENIHIGMFDHEGEDLPTAMERSNRAIAEGVGLTPGCTVLDTGCGYGAFARFLASEYGCRVLATNISERELAWGAELTAKAGLDHLVSFDKADFHDLQYDDASFDFTCSQEAFLHAADKQAVLDEAFRVLKPGGRLFFTDLLVRAGTPDDVRARIYDRVKSPDMWDSGDYLQGLRQAGFRIVRHDDWSANVAPTYAWVRGQLERRRAEFESRIGKEVVDRTSAALAFWVDSARGGMIGWEYVIGERPA